MNVKITANLAIFVLISIFITYLSILFPQKIGSYKIVAGWPITMYKTEYKRVGDITNTGRIIRKVKRTNTVMQERVLLNIFLWTVLFQFTWFVYHKLRNIKGISQAL